MRLLFHQVVSKNHYSLPRRESLATHLIVCRDTSHHHRGRDRVSQSLIDCCWYEASVVA